MSNSPHQSPLRANHSPLDTFLLGNSHTQRNQTVFHHYDISHVAHYHQRTCIQRRNPQFPILTLALYREEYQNTPAILKMKHTLRAMA
jgi:hypothetical protein